MARKKNHRILDIRALWHSRNFQILVLDERGPIISDKEMKRSLRKPFFGSSGFIEQTYKTYYPC